MYSEIFSISSASEDIDHVTFSNLLLSVKFHRGKIINKKYNKITLLYRFVLRASYFRQYNSTGTLQRSRNYIYYEYETANRKCALPGSANI
jgi:hypothetical protein